MASISTSCRHWNVVQGKSLAVDCEVSENGKYEQILRQVINLNQLESTKSARDRVLSHARLCSDRC